MDGILKLKNLTSVSDCMAQLCMFYSDSYALMQGARIKTFSFQFGGVLSYCG